MARNISTRASKGSQRHHGIKRKRSSEDLSTLDIRVSELNPTAAPLPTTFSALPLSHATARGLSSAHFTTLTPIQRRAIPFALCGRDLLGAAQTGSGKTLAFLVPLLETLVRARWTLHDGLGALVLAPTRELAVQTFEVLRRVGRYHDFSAGLVIGGKSLREEQERLAKMNILVCTPGRVLQHLDQTAAFETGNLQMLVLDEADRIMDMGFQSSVDAIVEHLPRQRQTLLFSATQTKKVSDLARLSLQEPEYVSTDDSSSSATPATLRQNYVITPLPEKLDALWSFIRSNVKAKMLVFLSSGKQVRYIYETFRRLQPGVPLLQLHGRQKQGARLDVTSRFARSKHACLFSTDVAARGLDFPAVDWVVQVDCPEDVETYIHRVGRTARYEKDGRAVLFLDPSEEAMVSRLVEKNVPIEQIKIRAKKQQSIQSQLQNLCFKEPEVKYLGQKAFISYAKSIHLQKDKEVFKVEELPLDDFCTNLGLPGTPSIKFLDGDDVKRLKNAPRMADSSSDEEQKEDFVSANTGEAQKPVRTKYERMFERRNQDVLAPHYSNLIEDERHDPQDVAGNPDFLAVRSRTAYENGTPSKDGIPLQPQTISLPGKEPLLIDSKRREKLLTSKRLLAKLKGAGQKLVYDDEGKPHQVYELEDEVAFRKKGPLGDQRARFLEAERDRVKKADIGDRDLVKEKRRAKKEKLRDRKHQELEAENRMDDGEVRVELAPYGEGAGCSAGFKDRNSASASPAIDRPVETEKSEKKWFERDDNGESVGMRRKEFDSHRGEGIGPESLEDWEDLAGQYL